MGIFSLFGKKQEDKETIPARPGKEEPSEQAQPADSVLAARFQKEEFLSLVEGLAGKRHVTVGLFGDQGAGKTVTLSALERCMTGKNRLWELWLQTPAEDNPVKYVGLRYNGCSFLFADYPGDPVTDDDLRDIGDAAAKTDVALLTLSGAGDAPGLLRHMDLIRATRISNVILFHNKTDKAADPAELDAAERLASQAMEARGLSFLGRPVPIVRGSALQAAQDPDSPWAEELLELAVLAEQCAHE